MNPKISVIIPAYNCATFITQTLESLFQQTRPADEIIVVDDGSTDNSVEVLRRFSDSIVLIQQFNQGVSVARNRGVQAATGDWIAFVDSDDVWHPRKLQYQLAALQQYPDAVLSYTGFKVWTADASGRYPMVFEELPELTPNYSCDWMYHQMLLTNWVLTSASLLKRDLFNEIGGFDKALVVAEDWDLFLKMSRLGRFAKVNLPMVLYRQSSGSLMSAAKSFDYASHVIDKNLSEYGFKSPDGSCTDMVAYKKQAFTRHYSYGLSALQQRWYRKAFSAFIKSLRYRFFAPRLWLNILYSGIMSVFLNR